MQAIDMYITKSEYCVCVCVCVCSQTAGVPKVTLLSYNHVAGRDYFVYGPVLRRYEICTENGGKESQQFA